MGSTSLRSAASRSSFLLTRRRPQPKQPQHMFGWLSKKPLGCDLTVSASWPSSLEQVARFLHKHQDHTLVKPTFPTRELGHGEAKRRRPQVLSEVSERGLCLLR